MKNAAHYVLTLENEYPVARQLSLRVRPGLPRFRFSSGFRNTLQLTERIRAYAHTKNKKLPGSTVYFDVPTQGKILHPDRALLALLFPQDFPTPLPTLSVGEVGIDGVFTHSEADCLRAELAAYQAGITYALPPCATSKKPSLIECLLPPSLVRLLTISLAGGHHLLLIGERGMGKTKLFEVIQNILPEPSLSYAQSAYASGVFPAPFLLSPGRQVSLGKPSHVYAAEGTTLFVDDIALHTEQVRRQLLSILTATANKVSDFAQPEHFCTTVIGTTNRCPCGSIPCSCAPVIRERYQAKLSGVLLDRFPLSQLVTHEHLPVCPLAEMQSQISRVRGLHTQSPQTNQLLSIQQLVHQVSREALSEISHLETRVTLSHRHHHALLAVTLTIAQLADREACKEDVLEAYQYCGKAAKLLQ
jgi:energy-coupling factor transporter ATP-binding protein EcfA2